MKTKINAIVDKSIFEDERYKGTEFVKEEVVALKVSCTKTTNYTAYIDVNKDMYVSTLVFMNSVAAEINNRIELAKDWEIMHSNRSEELGAEFDDYEEYIKDIFAKCNKCFSYKFKYTFDGKEVNIINNDKEEFTKIDILAHLGEPEFDCVREWLADDIAHALTERFGYYWSDNFETIFVK